MNISFFTYLCVAIVVTVIVLVATAILSIVINIITMGDDVRHINKFIVAWLISSIGFGACLTEILYQIGVL